MAVDARTRVLALALAHVYARLVLRVFSRSDQHVDARCAQLDAGEPHFGIARAWRRYGDACPVRLEDEPYAVRIAVREEDGYRGSGR
jgi:hypothetical protein